MATTFNVISLGRTADLDTVEGNNNAEGASDLVGLTFGSEDAPLLEQIQTLSPGSNSYRSGDDRVYDMANTTSETFRIDDGPDQEFDGVAAYWATITYADGSTANISAVIFQDTDGNSYLAPEFTANDDQRALQAKPIQSLTLDRVAVDSDVSGFVADRQTGNFAVCFAQGTQIATPMGCRPVESLAAGDMVSCVDGGQRAIRWIGSRRVAATGAMRPVRIAAGALGAGLPARDLVVSQQHRVLSCSPVAARMFGVSQVLIAAKKLVGLPGIALAEDLEQIAYWHFLCDRHEVVMANGAPAEALFAGDQACIALGPHAVAEIRSQCPDLAWRFEGDVPSRPLPPPGRQRAFARRLMKNAKPVIEDRGAPRLVALAMARASRDHGAVSISTRSESASCNRSITSKWCLPGAITWGMSHASASQRA